MNERDEILTEAAGELYKKLEDKSLKAVSMEAVFDALGIGYTGPYLLPEDVKALADLLMPPTCRNLFDRNVQAVGLRDVFKCSECGSQAKMNNISGIAGSVYACPCCGAVVVKK